MAEIDCYRPSCNAIQALNACLLNASWLEATKSGDCATACREPTSVLDLQTSSLSSQHSFNSTSDETSTAIQTVADQLLSDEQDSAFLMEETTADHAAGHAPNSSNMLVDQEILTWMELMQNSAVVEVSEAGAPLVPGLQEDPNQHLSRHQLQHLQDIRRHVGAYSQCTDMDLDDFEVGTMESIDNIPHSSHVEAGATYTLSSPQPLQQQQLLCQQRAAATSSMLEPEENRLVSHTSSTLLSGQLRPAGRSYQQNVGSAIDSQATPSLPSMFDSTTAIPASQLQNYTVVPTAELLRLLSAQNLAPSPTVAGPLGANLASDHGPGGSAGRPFVMGAAAAPLHHNLRWAPRVAPEQENGLHLVHLLLACAEAIDLCENTIAEPMLVRLRAIADREGDPMQRIALYFAEALTERLANEMALPSPGRGGGNQFTSDPDCIEVAAPAAAAASALERDIAYQAYYQILPFQKFAHFTANQALLEVVADYPRVHIVDFNIRQGLQWPSFMQSLALLPRGPPRLRITSVQTDGAAARRTGTRLAEFARSLQVPFEFHVIEENLETFHRGMVCAQQPDEALAVNCSDILHRVLRKEGKLHSLLCKIRSLRPTVVTVQEADANHNVPSFMARFVQALHYYCAVFDSLEATLQRTSVERLRIEHLCFGAEIRSIVALEGVDRDVRHVRAEAWQALFQQAGFQEVPVSRYAADQAQLLLSLYETSDNVNVPFRLSPEFGGLSLGWQETPVMVVSAWTC